MLKEFREFAMRGNVVDMAVGIIIGAAFGGIVKSVVDDVIMPPIGLLLGNVDFSNLFITLKQGAAAGPYATLELARKAGAVTLNYGAFFNTIVSFVIVAFSVFLLVKGMNQLKRQQEQPLLRRPQRSVLTACPRYQLRRRSAPTARLSCK